MPDVSRMLSIVAERQTDLCNGGIECVVEIDKCVVGPDVAPQLLACKPCEKGIG